MLNVMLENVSDIAVMCNIFICTHTDEEAAWRWRRVGVGGGWWLLYKGQRSHASLSAPWLVGIVCFKLWAVQWWVLYFALMGVVCFYEKGNTRMHQCKTLCTLGSGNCTLYCGTHSVCFILRALNASISPCSSALCTAMSSDAVCRNFAVQCHKRRKRCACI